MEEAPHPDLPDSYVGVFRYCDSGDIIFLICQVISENHVIKEYVTLWTESLLKEDFGTGVFLWILQKF